MKSREARRREELETRIRTLRKEGTLIRARAERAKRDLATHERELNRLEHEKFQIEQGQLIFPASFTRTGT